MDVNNLIHMANQIGGFFESMPDRQQALADIAAHLKKFWDPRMRRELLQYIDEQGGAPLIDIVQEAIRTHRAAIL
jgi:formate dehydrogenase subunit delta